MLDTLTANFFPQFRQRRPGARTYMQQWLERNAIYRHVPGRLIIRVAPDDTNAAIAASGAFEGRFSVPHRSRLYAISGSSTEAAGFDLQIRAGDTQQTLFGRRAFYSNASGAPYFLPKPMLLMSDGVNADAQIIVQAWNRAAALNTIQVLLWIVAPETGPLAQEKTA